VSFACIAFCKLVTGHCLYCFSVFLHILFYVKIQITFLSLALLSLCISTVI